MGRKIRRCLAGSLGSLLLMLAMVGSAAVCFATDTRETKRQTVRVVYPLQTGMTELDENGNYSGYTYEYLQRIAQFTGWTYEFITFPGMDEDEALMKSIEMVQSGEADIMGGTLKLEGMTEQFDYPEQAYGAVYTTLSVLENNAEVTESNFMMKSPLRVAVIGQASTRRQELRDYFQAIGASCEEVLCTGAEEQRQALLDGRADALLRVSLSFVKGTRQIAQFAPRPYYLVTTKGNAELAGQLDEAIKAVNENYPYFQARLFQKYFGDSSGGFMLSEQEKEYLSGHAVIHALYMTDCAPYSQQKDGTPSGILVSVLDDFAAAVGVRVAYTPVDSLEQLAQYYESTERFDCVLGTLFCMNSTEQYGMVTTNTLFQADVKQYYRRGDSGKPLEDSVVALHRGCGLAEDLKNAREIRWYDQIEQCLAAVESGECDSGFADNYSIEYAMVKSNILCTTVPFYGKRENVQIFMLNNGDLHYLSIFNRYINNLDDQKIYTYITEGSRVTYRQGTLDFIVNNPLTAGAWILSMLLLVAFAVTMAVLVRKLKSANTKLRQASSAKSDFLSRISHDMRTPLNGILGLLSLIKGQEDCAPIRGELGQMELSGKYLLDLINDTLDVEKIESGHLELHPVVSDCRGVMDNIVELLRPGLEEKKIRLNLHMEKAVFGILYLDVGRFEQIFVNLVGNSIKFSPENSDIDITMETVSEENRVLTDRITIRDHGIGISEEFLPHIFEPFSQENSTTTSRYKGTGLGMTIGQQIIRLMNGEIHVTSVQGEGTEFTFTVQIPLATEAQVAQAALPVRAANLDVLRDKRVLLFEDHPLNAEIARRLLEKKSIRVDRAENGKEGVELFRKAGEKYYDAILMDIRMPVMDGIEATRAIRRLDGYARTVPIIAMTANALDEDVERCREAGMNAHLAKPIDPQKLFEVLSSELEKQDPSGKA